MLVNKGEYSRVILDLKGGRRIIIVRATENVHWVAPGEDARVTCTVIGVKPVEDTEAICSRAIYINDNPDPEEVKKGDEIVLSHRTFLYGTEDMEEKDEGEEY